MKEKNMGFVIAITLAALAGGLTVLARTRTARMHRYAKRNRAQFDRRKCTLTTPITAGRLELLKDYFPLFYNVMTMADKLAFMRLADAKIYKDENPKSSPEELTLFAAEFRTRSFPVLKVAPHHSPFCRSQYMTVRTNIPEIDRSYRISAPDMAAGLLFTPYIKRLLKNRQDVYLEINDNAFLYHENRLIPAEELDAFHCRAAQLLAEIENTIINLDKPGDATIACQNAQVPKEPPKPQLSDTEFLAKAQTMLSAMRPQDVARAHGSGGLRGLGGIVLLVLLLAIPVVAWLLIKNFPR